MFGWSPGPLQELLSTPDLPPWFKLLGNLKVASHELVRITGGDADFARPFLQAAEAAIEASRERYVCDLENAKLLEQEQSWLPFLWGRMEEAERGDLRRQFEDSVAWVKEEHAKFMEEVLAAPQWAALRKECGYDS